MTRQIVKLAGALSLAALPLSGLVSAQTKVSATPVQYVSEQPAGEWLAHVFFGAEVQDASGMVIGDINDLVFDRSGKITTIVLGVGGLLGIGEKTVGVPFREFTFKVGPEGARVIVLALSKEDLNASPTFKAVEKTTYDTMRDKAVALGRRASVKAGELKDQAMKKVDEMKPGAPKKP